MGGTTAPTLESLGWRNGSLQLQMVAADTDALARFAQALTARGLNADVESTTIERERHLGADQRHDGARS